MEYQFLEIGRDDGILTVTLSREANLNALTCEMLREIRKCFEKIQQNPTGIKGIILTGKGSKAFAAGADIKELTTLTPENAYSVTVDGNATMDLIENFSIPVIAAINGYALGGGLELALTCHIRIAGSHSKMGLPESSLGLLPGYGGTQRLPRMVGRARAIEMICSGEMISAEEALRIGLISYITEPGGEHAKATELLRKINRNASTSVAGILKATYLASTFREDGPAYEREVFIELLNSENGREGMQAFIEKRKPIFK